MCSRLCDGCMPCEFPELFYIQFHVVLSFPASSLAFLSIVLSVLSMGTNPNAVLSFFVYLLFLLHSVFLSPPNNKK